MPLAPGDYDPPVPDPPDLSTIETQAEWYAAYLAARERKKAENQQYGVGNNMTPETIAKIRAHKCGNRKLATVSALARMNKMLKNAGPDLAAAITGDASIGLQITALNDALTEALSALGLQGAAGGGQIIEVDEITSGNIPTRVWLGSIDIPAGQADDAAQAAFGLAEGKFADAAGRLRARLALVVRAIGTLNDLGNSDQKPNDGGQVGDPAHQHKGVAEK